MHTNNPYLKSAHRRLTLDRHLKAADIVALFFCLAAVLFLLSGVLLPIRKTGLEVTPLAPLDKQEAPISGHGFASGAVYPATPSPEIHGSLKFYGSWIGSDQSTGTVHSAWYKPAPEINMFISGSSAQPGMRLFLEVASVTSQVTIVPISPSQDPGTTWRLVNISLKQFNNAAKFRIIAVDGSISLGGWVGFSTPFESSGAFHFNIWRDLLLLLLTTAGAIVAFISPGLLLRGYLIRRGRPNISFIWIPIPGLLGLCILGLFSWIGPHFLSARLISRLGLALLIVYSTYYFFRTPLSAITTPLERKVLLVLLVLVSIAVAKSTYSVTPVGELYQGTISHTLEVGARSDSRVPYHVVQLITTRSRPYGSLASLLLSPWNFSYRGPVAALAASTIVLSSPVQVPSTMPDQPWTPFDPQGFAAYRIAMIVIACASLLTVFGLARLFLNEQWSLLAYLVTVTAPFTIHEIYFTWPKLEAAAFVLLAGYLVLTSKFLRSGLAFGVGYLCHPSALLSFPALLGLIVLAPRTPNPSPRRVMPELYRWIRQGAGLSLGLAVWLGVWRLINRRHFDQGGFFSYFWQVDGLPATWFNWLHVRADSLLNTLLPLNLFLFHRNHPAVNSISGPSPAVVQFFFQDWTGVPFGAGIIFFFCLAYLTYVSFRKARAWLFLIIGAPFALFVIYWGPISTGLLREGLHAWFLTLMIFSVVIWCKFRAGNRLLWRICSWALLFRGVEILAMLLLPAILSQHKLFQHQFALTDLLSLLTILAGTLWLSTFTFRQVEHMRKSNLLFA